MTNINSAVVLEDVCKNPVHMLHILHNSISMFKLLFKFFFFYDYYYFLLLLGHLMYNCMYV